MQELQETGLDPWAGKIPWTRKWQLTPVFLPGKFHGQRSLVGYSPWGRKESDMTERLHFHFYSAYKLNKQGDNIQSWRTPFPILNQSNVPCPVLTIASWPAYRFLRRQVRWSAIPISFQNFPQFVMIHTVKGFSVVNEADVFLELTYFK